VPVARAPAADASAALPGVLIVDDTPDKLVALESALTGLPVTIVKASSGREALRRLLVEDFAVILLDVRMPGMDGFETATLIRQRPRSEHTPIIFVTAVGDDVHVARGYSLKAVDYILTPVVSEVLRTKVSVLVDLYRMTAEVRRQARSLAHRAQQLHQLAAASLAINGALSLDKMLTVVAESARDILLAPRAVVRAQLDDGTHQALAAVAGSNHDATTEATVASIVAGTRRPYRVALEADGGTPLLAAPLTGRDGTHLGMVQVSGRAGARFTDEDEDLLVQLAQTAAIALENTLFSEAREANRLKDEFVATVSHELRTPLNAMLSWVWMLRRGPVDPANTTRAVEAIERSIKAQVRLVDDLLDISRITTGKLKLDLQPVHLGPIIQDAIDATMPTAEAKDVRVVTALEGDGGVVLGDSSRLQQIVWNLLSNAIKFTPAGGRVDVQLLRAGSEVILRVSDTGRGIPPAFLPHAFEPFRQAEAAASRRTGGLGLGLAIVRQLVERHGGRVEAESPGDGLGATFTVVLPLASPGEGVPALSLQPAAAAAAGVDGDGRPGSTVLAGFRVLIVEDDMCTQEAVALIVSEAGASVRTAGSTREGLTVLAAWRPHVVVCDIGLPGEDGYTFVRDLRAMAADAGGSTPAIAFTAYAQPPDRARALDAGFQSHVAKPVDPSELIRVLVETVRCDAATVDASRNGTEQTTALPEAVDAP